MSSGRKRSGEYFGENQVLSDIMGGIIFFLILFIFIQQIQFIKVFERMKISTLQEFIRKEIESACVKANLQEPAIVVDDGNPLLQKIVLTNDALRFASGDVKLRRKEDELILKTVGEVLRINEEVLQSVTIEGHADTVLLSEGMQSLYPTNWELSSGRATTVVRFLADSVNFNPYKLKSAGFSSYHPINPDSINLNRRIEIGILYSYDKQFMSCIRAKEIFKMEDIAAKSKKTNSDNEAVRISRNMDNDVANLKADSLKNGIEKSTFASRDFKILTRRNR